MDRHLLLVTYTIYEGGDDSDLVEELESADSYELDETSWLLYTEERAQWWYNRLEPLIYEDDELLVLRITIDDVAAEEGVRGDLEAWLARRR